MSLCPLQAGLGAGQAGKHGVMLCVQRGHLKTPRATSTGRRIAAELLASARAWLQLTESEVHGMV